MSFNWWNKQAGNLILGSRSYLTGKQGFLPDWQLKGKGLKEIFAPKQYVKAGEMIRKGVTDRTTGFATGLFGIGAVEYAQGKEGKFPDWGRPGEFPKVVDPSGGGQGLVNITLPEIPPFPKIPDFPDFPKIPDIKIPEGGLVDLSGVSEGMSDFAMALAMGLGSLGQGIGGGIPQIPSMQLMDEEGTPNILMLGGLAGVAYIVLKRKN